MPFIDILGFSVSLLGICSLVILYLRVRQLELLPRYNIPPLSTFLSETQRLLDREEAIYAIPPESEHRAYLCLYEDQILH